MSTNDYTDRLQKRRYNHEARGKVLLLPRTRLVVVPFEEHASGWNVTVIGGSDTYRPEGYSLSVGAQEIETAIQLYSEKRILADGRGAQLREGIADMDEFIAGNG